MHFYPIKFAPLIAALWNRLQWVNIQFAILSSSLESNPSLLHNEGDSYSGYTHKYCIMLTFLYCNYIYHGITKDSSNPNSITIFTGTNDYVVKAISKRTDFFIPQSETFNIENAGNFLNFDAKNVLMLYNFITSQLYLPVTT